MRARASGVEKWLQMHRHPPRSTKEVRLMDPLGLTKHSTRRCQFCDNATPS